MDDDDPDELVKLARRIDPEFRKAMREAMQMGEILAEQTAVMSFPFSAEDFVMVLRKILTAEKTDKNFSRIEWSKDEYAKFLTIMESWAALVLAAGDVPDRASAVEVLAFLSAHDTAPNA